MTRNETFAATALQGLIAARTNLDIQPEVETAWRYADAMETVAKQRDRINAEDSHPAREALLEAGVDVVEIVALTRYTCALTYGLDAARNENDDTFTDLEAKAIAATIRQYGRAVSSSTETIRARCTLSGYQGTCRSYEFHVPADAA